MTLSTYLHDHFLILDGAMGTRLQEEGLTAAERPETWNLSRPDLLTSIHREWFDAGSNVVYTNTFGANRLHFGVDELEKVIAAGVRNAARAREESKAPQPKFIALDIGPTGRLLKPLGDLDFEEAVEIYAQVVRIGVKYGVDLIAVETMSDSYETKAALLAVKETCDLPVFVSSAVGSDGKLMTGADAEAMVALLEGMGADAIGLNCSAGPASLLPVVRQYLENASVPVLFKPNAGLPRVDGNRTVYDVTPSEFAAVMREAARSGARIFGGCCGTTLAHIRALSDALKDLTPLPVTPKKKTWVSSYTHAVSFGSKPILIGERINPTGKKRLKEALRTHDLDYLLREGIRQQESGADVLDVNVGLPGIDEKAMLTEVVLALQGVADIPLQIDTADPAAMESALRRYNGKALVNSVSGKEESMRAIFPLVKKYGGVVVALTLDETGIPTDAKGRLEIAKRILAVGAEYGLSEKDFLFDTLAMSISADPDAARVTLQSLSLIREELGCYTSLGVSNISFGLPVRDVMNSTFFALALANNLSAAILNPDSLAMRGVYHAYLALCGQDANCSDYLKFAEQLPVQTVASTPVAAESSRFPAADTLQGAIRSGLRERAAALTSELLGSRQSLEIIENEIVPALDAVGRGFEEKRVYLPQLLMSAEAAGAAFEVIRSAAIASRANLPVRSVVILATVEGDIHDIGKNIVRLLLENYGFRVVDLGRDVPVAKVVEATIRTHAPLVGLSALMTTTLPAMEETVKALRKEAHWCRVMVGGAVLTADYALQMGADFYSADAMGAVRYAESLEKAGT